MSEIEYNEFHHGQVRVECILPIQILQELEITRRTNEHGSLLVKGILDERGKDIIQRVGSKEPIIVYGKNDSGERVLFSGVISETDLCFRNGIYYVTIKGLSWSSLLDYKKKNRSFQNKAMSYSSVIHTVLEDYADSICLYGISDSEQSIGQFVLQYRETDWEFCKRLATHFNTCLVADIFGNGPRFHFGLPKKVEKLSSIESVVVKRDDASYQQALTEGFFVIEEQFAKYLINAQVYLGLGSKVDYDNKELIVQGCHIYLNKGVLCCEYVLGDEASLLVRRKSNEHIKGVSLLGEVLDTANESIKIKLKIDKEQPVDTACWFPYASQANNLFYCMPEIGTSVSLLFPDSEEADCIAMNAVRRNGSNCAKTSNPQMKYMAIPEGKEFKLGITDIDFSAHEKLFMSLDGKKGVTVQSDGNVNIFTRQKLLMEAKELIQIFAKTGNIVVGAKEQSSLYLLGGPEGDTHIKAGNNLIYEGRRKEIFTERLNSEIAYEEKKFDWGKLACNVLIGLAAVALTVATAGAFAVAAGAAAATVGAVVIGGAISGTIAVGFMAVSDIASGEVSDWQDYAFAGFKGAVEGAISGAVLGVKALQATKLIGKMLVSGGVSFLTDAVSQGLEILYYGEGTYDWKRGLLSFGIGFLMPLGSELIRNGTRKILGKFGKKMPDWLVKAFCKLDGDPVDVISGNVLYDAVDFELPGPIPLQWKRIWCSASRIVGHLGHGTRYSYEMGLEVLVDVYAVAVYLQDGRVAIFPDIMVGEESFSYENRMLLRRKDNCYELFDLESRYSYILSPSENGYLSYKLTMIKNTLGHRIEFFYNQNGYLNHIVDSVGRELDVTTNAQGRITQVELREGMVKHFLVGYAYNSEQDLCTITDAVGADALLKYRNHLMIKKVDRNKDAFYWEYDCYGDGAKVIHAWGDGGVLSLWMEYHEEDRYNAVRTALNNKPTEYHYNDKMLCTRIVYPDLTETREVYNELYQLESAIDEEGRFTKYRYDEYSRIIEIIQADSSKIQMVYDDAGRLIKQQNPEGDCVEWVYNEDNTLQKIVDENGTESTFAYNQDKLVEKVWNAAGEEISIWYDRHKNVSKVVLPNGSASEWKYDYRGNSLSHTGPLGAVETYTYDKLNRLVRAKLSDGNEVTLAYNAYEDVVLAKDKYSEIAFTYDILGNIVSRVEGERKLQYRYNNQGHLMSIINEKGEFYQFERDVKGNVIKETGYDKKVCIYELDYSGLVKRVKRPGGRFTQYSYDKLCRVIRADYQDKSYEEYVYNKNGLLTEAKNQYITIKLERDKAGKLLKEWQDEHWVASEYDVTGNRLQVSSSYGAKVLSKRDKMGQVTHMVVYLDKESPWVAKMAYNATGQEVLRQVSGGVVNSFSYDEVGRPVSHKISGERDRLHRHRRYEWDVNYCLKKMTNELTKGSIIYSYDRFSNLVSAKDTRILSVFRTFDEVGNVYETEDRSDRIYGAGSRLEMSGIDLKEKRNTFQGGYGKLVTKGVEYLYDEEGNLAMKVETDGSVWEYSYYGNGLLRKVVRPDKSAVIFKYDALGRRIEKCITKAGSEKVISFAEKKSLEEESKWETIGGVRIRRPNMELQKPHVVQGDTASIYEGESTLTDSGQNTAMIEKVIHFLWDGNTIFHEWEENAAGSKKPQQKIDYQANYVVKLAEKKMQGAKEKTVKREPAPESLVTWIFQDDFVPRAKITKDGRYSIMTDYLGTPVGAYDENGNLVWERELDINGKVMPAGKDSYGRTLQEVGDRIFIPFRFQGQYEDEEIGLYYNRFRYYDPEIGQYTQQDPIGLTGGNPTLYGYVYNTNVQVDELGLSWSDFLRALGITQPGGLTNPHGHHIVFKGQFRGKRGVYVGKSQAILKYFNIDINDPANLMWASNTKGVHTTSNAKLVSERLKSMQAELTAQIDSGKMSFEQARSAMKKELQNIGDDVFSHY